MTLNCLLKVKHLLLLFQWSLAVSGLVIVLNRQLFFFGAPKTKCVKFLTIYSLISSATFV